MNRLHLIFFSFLAIAQQLNAMEDQSRGFINDRKRKHEHVDCGSGQAEAHGQMKRARLLRPEETNNSNTNYNSINDYLNSEQFALEYAENMQFLHEYYPQLFDAEAVEDSQKSHAGQVRTIVVSRNDSNFPLKDHVSESQAAQALTISEDTDVYDIDGNFLFGIRYNAVSISDSHIRTISDLAKSSQSRGAAAGHLNIAAARAAMTVKNKNRAIILKGTGFIFEGNSKTSRARTNKQYTSTMGRTVLRPVLSANKLEKLSIIKPELISMSQLFKKEWTDVYADYIESFKDNGYSAAFVVGSVFSSAAVNTHTLDSAGKVVKDARAAAHTDPHNKLSVELMLTFKYNIEGGDLYFPEFGKNGIVFKLDHESIICFRGTHQKHAVTQIKQAIAGIPSLRVTMVGFLMKLGETTLKKIKEAPATE